MADSNDWPERTSAFCDWQALACGGLGGATRFITARVACSASSTPLGFALLAFGPSSPSSAAADDAPLSSWQHECLRSLCETLGGAVLASRRCVALWAQRR